MCISVCGLFKFCLYDQYFLELVRVEVSATDVCILYLGFCVM